MFVFDVYAIGDAELLYYALNGLAMIMNTGDWSTLTRIAIALGLLFAGFKAFAAIGDGRSVGPILVAFVLGWAFFGPGSRSTVSLIDIYTGSVRQVANVPIGLAAPMSLVSKAGHRMAELMEAAFSLPDSGKMTVAGYGDPLRVMLALRDADPAVANSDGSASGDLRRTIGQYVADCVMIDVNNISPMVTRESLSKAADMWAEMGKSNWTNIDIMVYLPGLSPYPKQMSCWEAHDAITAYLNSAFATDWGTYMMTAFGRTTAGSGNAASVVQGSLDAVGQSAVNAQTFMRNALVANLWRYGEGMYYSQSGSTTATIMYTQALQQRNAQWASEKSIFENYARPIMALVETITIGIAPFVIISLFVGSWGLMVMVNYLKLFAWISLWPPLMAIANLYTMVQARRAIDAAVSSGLDISTFAGMDTLWNAASSGLAVGGMAATLVPGLALFLVFGGTTAMSGIIGRMQSAEHVNEKIAAPDIATPAPLVAGESTNAFNPNIGMTARGLASPSVNLDVGQAASVTSAHAAVSQAQASVNQQASATWQSALAETNSGSISEMVGKMETGSTSQTEQTVLQRAQKFSEGQGWSSKETDAFKASALMAFGRKVDGGVGFKPFGIGGTASFGAELKSLMDNSGAFGAETSRTAASQFAEQASRDSSFMTQLQTAQKHDQSTGTQMTFQTGATATNAEQLSVANQRLDSAQEQFSRSQSASASTGHRVSIDYPQLAGMLSSRDGLPAMERVWEAREQSRNATGGTYAAWDQERAGVMQSLGRTTARDLPFAQKERLAEFLMTQRAGGVLAHESVEALMPAIASRGLLPGGDGGALGSQSLGERNTAAGLAPGASTADTARAAGASASAAAGGLSTSTSAGLARVRGEVAARRGAPGGVLGANVGAVEGRYAGNAGRIKASGTERGSNLGAQEFAEVEKKRDTADQQRGVMRDKADKQGGDAIDNGIKDTVNSALKGLGMGSKNEAGWTDADDPANRPL